MRLLAAIKRNLLSLIGDKPITETEWLACTNPLPMLEHVERLEHGGLSTPRKLRLFACACCRRHWDTLIDERSRTAVAMTESYVDGAASEVEGVAVRTGAIQALEDHARSADEYVYQAVAFVLNENAYQAAFNASAIIPAMLDRKSSYREDAEQCSLLRCIFGNPFHPGTRDPAWLSWHDSLLVSMARHIYESRDFADMPLLADALEEAGCTDADILNHCRQPGEHFRGCWVVDLLLGKS